jgi:uncharacterized iron-regulated membrane protein
MAETRLILLRRLWLNVHLWIGIGLAVLLIPISVSGGLLVFHDEVDALISPSRYAVTGPQVAQPASIYLGNARQAVAADPDRLRPTGAVLDVAEFRSSLVGFLHVFHENLTIPQYSGRQIVGWAGVGMLILSLTGLWLWWPRHGSLLRALRWSRSTRFTFNLHHTIGFWISLPLAVVSLTGIYLSFPQSARSFMSSVATMTPQGPRGFGAQPLEWTGLTIDRALAIAAQQAPGAQPANVFLPVASRGGHGAGQAWRVQLKRPDDPAPVTVMVDDRSGVAATAAAPQSGDRAASWIRWIHEGSHSGPVWKFAVFLTGVAPTIFAVTGTVMWLRRRAVKRRGGPRPAPQLRPAE